MEIQGIYASLSFDHITNEGRLLFLTPPRYKNALCDGWDKLNGKMLDIIAGEHREKRSNNANSYAWALINKLSGVIGTPPQSIYRECIRGIEGNSEVMEFPKKAMHLFVPSWEARGIGWIVEILDDNVDDETQEIRVIYGSSTYNRKQMKQLIDEIILNCEKWHIEIRTPDQIARMLSLWQKNE